MSVGKVILYGGISLLVLGAIFCPEDTKRFLDRIREFMDLIEKISVSAKNITENVKVTRDNVNCICCEDLQEWKDFNFAN